MNTSVLSAVFKRNLVSYFSTPTGYLFIGLFVLLSSAGAFFGDEFFNANLANLDQLNKFFPFIMLLFVPAITMSIWADEVRQGTDELLLTMPATDFDIVLGKYLAAVTIYTVSLLLSMASAYYVFVSQLGTPDLGLFLCTHFGYWLLGLAMLSVGMVASFLTRNLTVAFILGAVFNAPLVVMSRLDVVPRLDPKLATSVRAWSFGGQCEEFGRGILSLSGILYFLLIAGIMLYLCVILLGRRHWARGDGAGLQAGHFLVRCLCLAVIATAAVFFLQNHNLRRDATSERLTSLSPYTIKLVDDLKSDYDKARELSPKIERLEESEKKAQEGEKKAQEENAAKEKAAAAKATAAAAKSTAAKPADAKSTAAKLAEAKATAAMPADAKSTAAKPVDAKTTAAAPKPEEKKAEEKKPDENKVPAKADLPPAPLSEDTKELAKLKAQFELLKVQGPVRIDAYISPEVPEAYVQTRINLLTVLREFKIRGGDMVELNVNEIDRFDPLAEVAKARFNIVPKEVDDTRNGAIRRDHIFMGVAFTCGLEKVVLPFMERGLPPEYELVRSLCTVTRQKRKRIGVLETDAHVMGSFSMSGMTPEWMLIQELRKQYEVVQVNPAELLTPPKAGEPEKHYDVLLAIQPSALGPREMESFVAAVRAGQPTVIFEDPYFLWMRGIPGTYQPRRQQNPMMGMGQENQEKGDIHALWQLLGIDFSDGPDAEFNPMGGRPPASGTERVVWQRYSPYPKLGNIIQPEWVFIDHACGAKQPFCEEDQISSKLQHVFLIAPGFIEDTPEAVKRLVAKWHNKQYARQLNKEMNDLADQIEKAQKESDEDKFNALVDNWSDTQEEYNQVSGGGDGKKTIQPGQLKVDTSLEDLIVALLGHGHNRALLDLVADLRNRYPLPAADDEAEEGRTVLLTKGEADKTAEEAQRLGREAERLEREATMQKSAAGSGPANLMAASRLTRAAELKRAAAKLKQTVAELTTDGISLAEKGTPDDVALLKLRIVWTDEAASLKDQAAELLSKTGQKPEVAMLDEDAAAAKITLSGFKELAANMKTVGDVVKYAQEAVALQLKNRKFVPLIETGPDAGTIPTAHIAGPADDMQGQGAGLNPFRSLYYQPGQGQPYVLAAHITGEPRDRLSGSPLNVVLVADVEAVNDMFFEMRERGAIPGQDIVFDFDNVTFVLNALDSLAGDDRFLELRKRRPQHRTLTRFDERTAGAREESARAMENLRKEHDEAIKSAVKEVEGSLKKLRIEATKQHLDEQAILQKLAREENNLRRRLEEKKADNNTAYNAKIDRINNELEAKVVAMQGTCKLWAVIQPSIPILLVAVAVFFYLLAKEREGVSRKRLR